MGKQIIRTEHHTITVDEKTRNLLLDAAERVEAQGDAYDGSIFFRNSKEDNNIDNFDCGCAMGEMVYLLTSRHDMPHPGGISYFLGQNSSINDDFWLTFVAWTQTRKAQETIDMLRQLADTEGKTEVALEIEDTTNW